MPRVYFVPYTNGQDDAVPRRKWVGTQAQARAYVKSLGKEFGDKNVGGYQTVDVPLNKADFVKWLNDNSDIDNSDIEPMM